MIIHFAERFFCALLRVAAYQRTSVFLSLISKMFRHGFIFSPPIRSTFPAPIIISDYSNDIRWRIQAVKFLIMQFAPFCCYLVPHRPKYLPDHPTLLKPSAYVPPSLWETRFHAHAEQAKLYFGTFGLCIFTQQKGIVANPFRLLIHESSCNSARCIWSHRRQHRVIQQNVFILVTFVDRTF